MLAYWKQYILSWRTIALIFALGHLAGCAQEVEKLNSNSKAACYDDQPFSISDVSVNQSLSGNTYTTGFIAKNQKVYIDRSFIYQSLSTKYMGLPYILTANTDKSSDPADSSFITFTVNRPINLYVALDTRTTPPSWLQDWQKTADIISDSAVTRTLYMKSIDNCQISLGGNGGTSVSSMYTVLAEEQTDVTPPDDVVPDPTSPLIQVAINDVATTLQFNPVTIDVLNNDLNITDRSQVVLNLPATNSNQMGSMFIENDNRITYVPPSSNFVGNDSFNYNIQNNNGSTSTTSTAEVVVSVVCATCVEKIVTLSWNASTGSNAATGYKIFTSDTATSTASFYMDIASNRAGFNANLPSIDLNTNLDLNLQSGQSICFAVSAYNSAGESPSSSAVCTPPL